MEDLSRGPYHVLGSKDSKCKDVKSSPNNLFNTFLIKCLIILPPCQKLAS